MVLWWWSSLTKKHAFAFAPALESESIQWNIFDHNGGWLAKAWSLNWKARRFGFLLPTLAFFIIFFFKWTHFFTLLVNAVNLLCLSFVVSFDLGQWQWGLLFFQVTCQQFCSCWSRPETGNSQLRPPGWRTIIFSFIDYLVLPCISKKDLKRLKFVPLLK